MRALHLAAKHGNLTIVQQLINENAEIPRRCKVRILTARVYQSICQ